MTADSPDTSLDAIRREIDSIDDQILRLLAQRFKATEKVKAKKAHDGSILSSPFRPAREATMMQRLVDEAAPPLNPELLVRLWRVILSASIQSQAPVILHMDTVLGQDLAARLLVARHFCDMDVQLHKAPSNALEAAGRAPGDLALVAPNSDWASSFLEGASGEAQVIVTLPVLTRSPQPHILVFGHTAPQPSGDDETLLLLSQESGIVEGARWHDRSGASTLVGIAGFLDHTPAHPPGARIAGRYPRPLKVSP